jgi:hypothetical protein
MASRGTCGRQDALEIHARYNVFEVCVLIGIKLRRVKGLEAGCKDDGTHVEIENRFLLFEINRVIFAELCTGITFALFARIYGFKVYASLSVDGVLQGHGLCKRNVNGFAFVHANIELILHLLGTFLRANAAADAFVFVDVPGRLKDFDLKVAGVSRDTLHFGERDKVDVDVPADLDQLGGDNSHGTLIGGEGFIQLCHDSADAGGLLHKMHVET